MQTIVVRCTILPYHQQLNTVGKQSPQTYTVKYTREHLRPRNENKAVSLPSRDPTSVTPIHKPQTKDSTTTTPIADKADRKGNLSSLTQPPSSKPPCCHNAAKPTKRGILFQQEEYLTITQRAKSQGQGELTKHNQLQGPSGDQQKCPLKGKFSLNFF